MSFRLGDDQRGERSKRCPKVARLHELAAAGLPVPAGLVLDEPVLTHEDARLLTPMLAHGPVIARGAHREEDGDAASWAGLGHSVPGCRTLDAVAAAIDEIRAHGTSIWRDAYGGDACPPQVLVQVQIERAWLVVCVWTPEGEWYVEAHDAQGDVLSGGASPAFTGPLDRWEHPGRANVASVCAEVLAHVSGRHGLDLELVVDPNDRAWLVQARPLTAPLHPGWDAFAKAMAIEAEQTPTSLEGLLTLDAEHNPAPLSPAHGWLMDWLRRERPRAGDPVVLAGWLYVRTLPRALGASEPRRDVDVRATLARLRDEHLPHLRRAHDELVDRVRDASLADLGSEIDRALALFLEMIDCYLDELVPARRAHAGKRRPDPDAPLSLRDRAAYLDVLPAAWDVASPVLADLIAPDVSRPSPPAEIPDDVEAAATLLAEWDDHLFALGLAPLRAVYLRAAQLLALDPRHAFMLTPDELGELARGRALADFRPRMQARDQACRTQAQMRPPLRLWDGRPLPAAAGSWLRGIAIGDGFTGTLAPRRDLEDLIARPPGRGDVASLPALTAQSAVALDRLGVRAICTEYGGALSHGALMARELGLCALIGCRGCTSLPERTRVRLDTRTGRLVVLEPPPRD